MTFAALYWLVIAVLTCLVGWVVKRYLDRHSFCWFGIINISKWERETLTPPELAFVMEHELAHNRHGFLAGFTRGRARQLEELRAEREAIQAMLAQGYTLEEITQWALDSWTLHKFGCRAGDVYRKHNN